MRKYEAIQAVYVLGYSVTRLLWGLGAENPLTVVLHLIDIGEAHTTFQIARLNAHFIFF